MDDAALEAWVEDTVAPYRGVLPARLVDEMRVVVRATFAAHPVARQLIEEASERVPQQTSGVVGDDGAAEHPEVASGGKR